MEIDSPMKVAVDAAMLLGTGRAAMALTLIEQLPALIDAALKDAASEGFMRGQAHVIAAARERRQAAARMPAPRTANRLDLLRAALGDPCQRQLAKAALSMGDGLIERVAAGGATLSGTQWRKLRKVLA